MNLKVLLRRLIVANVVTIIAFLVSDAMFYDSLPPELLDYNERLYADESEAMLAAVIGLPLVFAYLVSLALLWKFKKSGRSLFAAVLTLNLIATAGMLPQVYPAPPTACLTISGLIDGLILGLIYFSELRHHFNPTDLESN